MPLPLLLFLPVAAACLAAGYAYHQARRRGLGRWLPAYACRALRRRGPVPGQPVHVLLCVADHYEPQLGGAAPEVARTRVDSWVRHYPRLFADFHDSDGRPPRHTFFYPAEEYEPEYLDALAGLCRQGYGEVEIHLHHDHDTADGLRHKLLAFKEVLAERHGLLARRRHTGAPAYAFIHGNWALCNARPDGRWCGVNNELDVLRETGCYVDMTLPSFPSPTQTRKVNSLYYAWDRPGRPRSHDSGLDVGAGPPPVNSLLLIQGPLVLDWRRRKWGVLPRVENGCLQGNQAPSLARLDLWVKAGVQVPARPDWYFVKLHTHGAKEANQRVLLGEAMVRFHEALAARAAADSQFHYHYVTAREMYNLARAAAAGWNGPVEAARDYELAGPGASVPNSGGPRPAGRPGFLSRGELAGRPGPGGPVRGGVPIDARLS
jgi:hypothetical protein